MIHGTVGEEPAVTKHERKIELKRTREGTVSKVIEPGRKLYSISFFNRRRLDDNTSLPFGYK